MAPLQASNLSSMVQLSVGITPTRHSSHQCGLNGGNSNKGTLRAALESAHSTRVGSRTQILITGFLGRKSLQTSQVLTFTNGTSKLLKQRKKMEEKRNPETPYICRTRSKLSGLAHLCPTGNKTKGKLPSKMQIES